MAPHQERVCCMSFKRHRGRIYHGYIVIGGATLVMITAWGTTRTFGVFLEPVLREFGWTRAVVSGAFTLAMVGMGIFGAVGGRITDRLGPKVVVIGCGVSLGCSYLLMSTIQTLWQLYVYYGLMVGIGMGVSSPMLSLGTRWFTRRRALMTGVLTAGGALGIMVFPFLFSLIIHTRGWRVAYLILGVMTLALMITGALLVKRDPADMGLRPFGDKNGNSLNSQEREKGASLRWAVGTRQYWLLSLVFSCDMFLMHVVSVHIVIHAIDQGISASNAASVLSVSAGISLVARVVIGNVADRIGCKKALVTCLILSEIAFAYLLLAKGLWMLYVFGVIFSFGLWATGGLVPAIAAELFGLRSIGTIYGSIAIGGSVGGAFGPMLVGYLYDVTGSYQLGFVLCLMVSTASLIALSMVKPIQNKDLLFPQRSAQSH
jgi:MFS family permease